MITAGTSHLCPSMPRPFSQADVTAARLPAFQAAVETPDMACARHQFAFAYGRAVGNRFSFFKGPRVQRRDYVYAGQ